DPLNISELNVIASGSSLGRLVSPTPGRSGVFVSAAPLNINELNESASSSFALGAGAAAFDAGGSTVSSFANISELNDSSFGSSAGGCAGGAPNRSFPPKSNAVTSSCAGSLNSGGCEAVGNSSAIVTWSSIGVRDLKLFM